MSKNEDPQRLLERLRKLCLSLPEASEVASWGHPNFRAGKKTFAVFEAYEDRPTIVVKQTVPDQTVLVEDERFFVPPYVGKHGWVGMWVDTEIEWGTIRELVLSSYRLVALKRMLAALDVD